MFGTNDVLIDILGNTSSSIAIFLFEIEISNDNQRGVGFQSKSMGRDSRGVDFVEYVSVKYFLSSSSMHSSTLLLIVIIPGKCSTIFKFHSLVVSLVGHRMAHSRR